MSLNLEQVIGNPSQFLDKVFASLREAKVDVSAFVCDHVCYRVDTTALYEAKKEEFVKFGATLLSESIIGGRRVATYKLRSPIRYQEREIWLVELPDVKPTSPYPTGLEHAEFATGPSIWKSMPSLYPHLTFDTRAQGKENNPDLSLEFPAHGIQVKFHENTLEEVIKSESVGAVSGTF